MTLGIDEKMLNLRKINLQKYQFYNEIFSYKIP